MAKLTTYFSDLVFYLLPKTGRKFTVLLPNATIEQPATDGSPLPVHRPFVAISPLDKATPLKTAPWLLDGEDLKVSYRRPRSKNFTTEKNFNRRVAVLKKVLKTSKIELDTDCTAAHPCRGLLSSRVSGLDVGKLSVAELSRTRTPVFKALTGHAGEVKGITDARVAVVVKHELEADRIVVERVAFRANRASQRVEIVGDKAAEMWVVNGLEGPAGPRNHDSDFEWFYNVLRRRPEAEVRRIPFYTTNAPVAGGGDCTPCCD